MQRQSATEEKGKTPKKKSHSLCEFSHSEWLFCCPREGSEMHLAVALDMILGVLLLSP